MRRTFITSTQLHPQHRRGQVLIFVALIIFGILGFAALVIDIGIVRLTARQMKQATDAAALEGVRFTDAAAASPETYTGRTASTETARRQTAADIVASLFDDDFDATDDDRNFGAGPQVNLTGGIALGGGFNASQDLSIGASPVYKPTLELNEANASDGDIVSSASDNSVTVRLRRTSAGSRPNEVSNGGPIPFLFGHGALLPLTYKAGGVPVTVGSTAETQPVVRVGVQQTLSGVTIPGCVNFGMSRAVWESLPANMPMIVPLVAENAGGTATALTEIGQIAAIAPTPFNGDGYCPVVENIGGTSRVIGFGWARVVPDPANLANVIITKHRDTTASETIAPENATARRSEAWDSLGALSNVDRQSVITANQNFSDPLVSAVLRPGGSL